MTTRRDAENKLTEHKRNFAEELAAVYAGNLADWAERQIKQGKTIEEIMHMAYYDGLIVGMQR